MPEVIYNDKQWSFNESLNNDSFASIHIRNIQRLAIQMFKFYKGLSLPLMENVFKLITEILYSSRHVSEFSRPVCLFILGPYGTWKIQKILKRRLRPGRFTFVHVVYVRLILKENFFLEHFLIFFKYCIIAGSEISCGGSSCRVKTRQLICFTNQ